MSNSNQILTSVRLGWLTVEAYARLRRFVQASHTPTHPQGNLAKRFDFSDRTLSEYHALQLAVHQLHLTAQQLVPSQPAPPIPGYQDLDQFLAGQVDLDTLQGQLESWSTQVWVALSTEDEILGRGFTYGGSLADTYWHTDILGPQGFADLLQPSRLEYIAARFDSIAEYLPPYTAKVLHYTLYKWRVAQQIKKLDLAGKQHKLRRLEAQAKVWHDLLFGSRRADSYLSVTDRHLINRAAIAITAILVVAALFLVWLIVLALSGPGATVIGIMDELPQELSDAQMALVSDVLDWQKWSALLATLSSVAILLTGLVTRLSGWVVGFYHFTKQWLTLQLICRRTYRH